MPEKPEAPKKFGKYNLAKFDFSGKLHLDDNVFFLLGELIELHHKTGEAYRTAEQSGEEDLVNDITADLVHKIYTAAVHAFVRECETGTAFETEFEAWYAENERLRKEREAAKHA